MIKPLFASLVFMLFVASANSQSVIPYNFDNTLPEVEVNRTQNHFEEIRLEQILYQQKLQELILKYNNTSSSKNKKKVADEMRVLIYDQTEKKLIEAREFIQDQRTRIDDLERKINETERNKAAFVEARVTFYTSPQALAQIQNPQDQIVVRRAIIRVQQSTSAK
jgi:vacuolar-type H+-ATPase subunit I/STV1